MVRQYITVCAVLVMSVTALCADIKLRIDGGVRDQNNVTILAQDSDYVLSVVSDERAAKVMIEGVHESENFQVYRGGTNSKMHMINGHVQSSISYQYHMRPLVVGAYTIGPAVVDISGSQHMSESLTVRVVSAAEYEKIAGRSQPGSGTLSCRLEVDQSTIVTGEQATVSVILEDEGQAQERSLQPPAFGKLSFTPIGEPFAQQFVDNGRAKVRVVQKYSVNADEPGNYLIGPAVAHFILPDQQGRDPFEAFFGMQMRGLLGGGKKKAVRSNSLEITVTALPDQDQDVDGVGTFDSFVATTEQTTVELNEPFTLRLALTGSGNFDAILTPTLTEVNDMNVYDSTTSFQADKNKPGHGTKVFEYVVQIERDGEHVIPSQIFTYYDVAEKEYKTVASQPLHITVKAARSATSSRAQNVVDEPDISDDEDDGEEFVDDSFDEGYDDDLIDEPLSSHSTGISWVLFALLFFVPALWFSRRRLQYLLFFLSERFGVTSQDKRDGLTIRRIVARGDTEQVHGFFMEVLARYWARSAELIDNEVIMQWAQQWGWDDKKTEQFASFIQQCEQAAFAPQLITAAAKKAILVKAEYWHTVLVASHKG